MENPVTVKVLFVCMGNICRSPTAEGVFRHIVREAGLEERIVADSAGTHAYHVGHPPDNRAQATAQIRGIDIGDLRARRVSDKDFEDYHYVLAMDSDNYEILIDLCPAEYRTRVRYFLDFATELNEKEVPDPYYGGTKGFERVFDLVDNAARGLLADIQANFLRQSGA